MIPVYCWNLLSLAATCTLGMIPLGNIRLFQIALATALALALMWALAAASASAALVADYQFNDNLDSSVGSALALTEVGAGGASYATETVNGADDRVRVFSAGAGLSLATDGLIPHNAYTIEITFRLSEAVTWERIFDASDASSDNGLYVKTNKLDYYDNHDSGGGAADHLGFDEVLADSYYTVSLSRSAGGLITVYQDGVKQITYLDAANTGIFQAPDYPARFFIDDNIIGGENSPGAVARIRVFDSDIPLPPDDGKNPTVTKVQCNYLVATGLDTCTAQVADTRPGTTLRPTGSVKFSSANGGAFVTGDSCDLIPTPASPNVSSCSVQYLPPTSTFPKVAAAYQGSSSHSPSKGNTTFYILGSPSGGFGVDLGVDPTLGKKTSSPIKFGCAKASSKKSSSVTVALTTSACMLEMSAAYEAAKNKAIGKPCPEQIKSYSDLKDCNPNYQQALEQWDREIEESAASAQELIDKRAAKFEELKDIINDYNKAAKGIIDRAGKSSLASLIGLAAKQRRAKSIPFGKARAVVKPGKQKQVRVKLAGNIKPILTFVRRMNKALPALDLKINLRLRVAVTTRKSRSAKPKRKSFTRVVPYSVSK